MNDFIMKDTLGSPAILTGLFALIGLILQRKSVTEIVSGTVKTILGFVILGCGTGILISSLDFFGSILEKVFAIQGVFPNNQVIVAVAQKAFGAQTAMIMLFGMIVNLILARCTKLKYIFLTGHHTMFMACMIAVILSAGGINGIILVLIGSLILGSLMVIMPALLQPYVREITGSNDFAVGHFGSVGYFTAAYLGKISGNKSQSTENIQVPKALGFLKDTSVAISLIMTLFFLIVALCAGPGYVESTVSAGQNFAVYSLMQAITFAAGVYIILAGVRMLLAEIVPAFKGIAVKVVPDAIPALDCPAIFPFAPNAALIGFFCSFIAGIIGMLLLPFLGLKAIVPGLVLHFFTGATAGAFGNGTGGYKGAIVGAFSNGILISLLLALLLSVLGAMGFQGATFGDTDFSVVGIILGKIMGLFMK